jgi:hypothetical protein
VDSARSDETAAVNPHAAYAAEQRRKLDVLIAGLRADGWDVVARRERDLAWAERDEARDEAERLRDALMEIAGGTLRPAHLVARLALDA